MSKHSTQDLPPPDDPSATYVPVPEDPSATYVPDPDAGTGTYVQLGVPEILRDPNRPDVPGYELLGELGRGGMGVVYRARQQGLDRDVAVKLLLDKFAAGGPSALRFADEARITGQLQHPGIPPVHQAGLLPNGRPFLAMKLIKGRTFDDLLKHPPADGGPHPIAVFEGVCQAVGYAHAHGVVHRDLKPANVMVGAYGEVQVMDWGLAKLVNGPPRPPDTATDAPDLTEVGPVHVKGDVTQAGSLLGTPAYMPPEQAIGAVDQIDARSDVFALGGILCAILTGYPPYSGTSVESIRQLAARGKLDDAKARLAGCGADPDLVDLCEWCLSPEQADRPADGGAVAAAVSALRLAADDRAKRAEVNRATAEVKADDERKLRRVQRLLFAGGLLAVAAIGAGAWYVQKQAADKGRSDAEAARLRTENVEVDAERARQELLARQRAERARDGVEDALARLPGLYGGALWEEAAARVDGADALLGRDGDLLLRERVAAARRTTAFLARLDRIRLGKEAVRSKAAPADPLRLDEVALETRPDRAGAAAEYAAAFREHGLDVPAGVPVAVAWRVKDSPVRGHLLAALDDWALTEPDPGRRGRVFAVTALATGQQWRVRLALAWDDPARLAEVYDAIPPADRSATVAVVVGYQLDRLGADGARRLEDARRRHPDDFWLLYALGAVGGDRQADRRAGAYVAALALRPNTPAVMLNLGNVYLAKGDWDGAVAAYDDALRIDPGLTVAHLNRGNAFLGKRDLARAATAYREVIRIDPGHAEAHCNLGRVLVDQGRLADALEELRAGHRLGSARPNWPYRSDAWVAECERLLDLDRRFPPIRSGAAEPADTREALALADFALQPFKGEYALALRLYARAAAADPGLLDATRYNSARAAVRLAAGEDRSAEPGWDEWYSLLDRAHGWLTADLAGLRGRAGSDEPGVRLLAANALTRWAADPALAAVRDPDHRRRMPEEEQKRWAAFWAEVEYARRLAAR
ncbi:MAG: hypothetical protein C0501_19290 [Isosphaera sp.]|nr:hypothetical protein [Isosphaera sp.]